MTSLLRRFSNGYYRFDRFLLPISNRNLCTARKKIDNPKSIDNRQKSIDNPSKSIDSTDRHLAISAKTLGNIDWSNSKTFDDDDHVTRNDSTSQNREVAESSTNENRPADQSTNQNRPSADQSANQEKTSPADDDDLSAINEARIAEIMEYYSQYEKELTEGGYKDPEREKWLDEGAAPDQRKYPISLQRGKEGVFELDEIVTVMREQKMMDVCVIMLPKEIGYVDYMVLGTAFSLRHLTATCQYIGQLYKKKRGPQDPAGFGPAPRQADWVPMELGNLVVHLMTNDVRRRYDVETLWSVGPDFDELTNEKSEFEDFHEKFEQFRKEIQKTQT